MNDSKLSIMQRLRDETSDLHSHAESRTLQREIAKGTIDRSIFVAYLGQLYAVHDALESALRDVEGHHPAISALATPERMRVPDLDRDLEFYGLDREQLEAGGAAERFVSLVEHTREAEPVALLGALYVLEGSTNGGRFLAQVLRKSWNLDGGGVTYFDPYGDQQGPVWAAFKREMDEASFEARHEDAIVEMARRTFEAIAEVSDEVATSGA
jgi:heme oxygenase